jgi:hypothetical protein
MVVTEPLHILPLEDNPVDVEMIRFELQEAGFIFTLKAVAARRGIGNDTRMRKIP